jgi:NifB/MoaA-like Fe-S oxidoreductase
LPEYDYYEDFPQLENGVGMCTLFEKEFNDGLKLVSGEYKSGCTGIVTGTSAAALISRLAGKIDPKIKVYPIRNDFFGSTVTTSGLLSGLDVISQVKPKALADKCKRIFLPNNMFRSGTDLTLDDIKLAEIGGALDMTTMIGAAAGGDFLKQLYFGVG